MEAWKHIIISLVFSFGFLLGNVLIDVDHSGSIREKWDCLTKNKCSEDMKRGILHQPLIMFSLIAFFLAISLGIFFHMLSDNLVFRFLQ